VSLFLTKERQSFNDKKGPKASGTHKNCGLKNPIGSITLDAGVTDHPCGTGEPPDAPHLSSTNFGKKTG